MGRLTAQGIYDICTPISAAEAQPGDIIFFKGTYDTPGVSHVGIVRPARTIVNVVKGGMN